MPGSSASSLFPATRWTLLHRVRAGSGPEAFAALDTLCRAYWYPLYCVARQKRLSEHDAQDAVQGFFESMLRRETFSTADEATGKLRQLLLCAFDRYCIEQWHRARCQKRGGGAEHVEFTPLIDAARAEERYLKSGCSGGMTIEAFYNRAWAAAVMERSLEVLRSDYIKRGWEERFNLLVGRLLQKEEESSVEDPAAGAGMSAGSLRVALHRMRGHYRDKIERELAATLDTDDPQLIREEMVELFRAFT